MLKKRVNGKHFIIVMLILICLPFTTASAASKLNLYYYGTKQNVTYTGIQIKYTFNGSAINMRNTPGILINGVSLASFNDVFVRSEIGMDYTYNESKGILTLTKDKTTLVMTTGSTTATLNGKKVTLSAAPIKVKFKSANTSKLLVPIEYVAKSFGLTYTWNSSTSTGAIAEALNLYYNNKNVTYTSTRGDVTINGNNVKLGTMPSIIINNTAMLRAWQVFHTTSIGAGYSYNKTTQKLTLTKGETVVELTMGNKTAYVNGKARTMDTAPLVVTNRDTNLSYVMVPGSFVASCLGYDYTWDSAKKTSKLTTSTTPVEADPDDADGPELSGEPLPDTPVLSLGISSDYLEEYKYLSNLPNVTEISEDTASTAYISTLTKEASATNNSEVYAIHSNLPFSKTTAALQDNLLTVHINNAVVSTSSYTLGGLLAGTITTNQSQTGDISSDIYFSLLDTNLKYALTLSDDKCTLYVTVFYNYINTITAGISGGNNYIQIAGMKDLTVNLGESGNYITVQLPGTINTIGEISQLTGLDSVKSISVTGSNPTTIILEKADTTSYTVSQTGSIYTIIFTEPDQTQDTSGATYSIDLPLPGDIFFTDLTTEDRYYENEIIITIPGNQVDFYNANPVKSTSSVINDISVYNTNGDTQIVIDTAKLQGFKLSQTDNGAKVTMGDPRAIYKNIVVLDPGHGGTDPGAMASLNGVTINEKDVVFKILYTLGQKYFNASDSEIKAYYTRHDNTKIDLYERAAFAEKVGADLFVSLHLNANTSITPKGTEVYYTSTNNAPSETGLTSLNLANIFLNALPDIVGTDRRKVSSANYVVTKYNTVPAILIELGFMSNKGDLKLMTDPNIQEAVASAMYDTLCDVFQSYPTGR